MEFVKNIPAHLDKHCGSKDLMSVADHGVRDLGTTWGGCISARYLKGIHADGDNLVVVQYLNKERSNVHQTSDQERLDLDGVGGGSVTSPTRPVKPAEAESPQLDKSARP